MKKVLSLLCLASLMNCFVPSFGATRVPAGTTIPITIDTKTTSKNVISGGTINAKIESDVKINNIIVFKEGDNATINVLSTKKAGFVGIPGEMVLCGGKVFDINGNEHKFEFNRQIVGEEKTWPKACLGVSIFFLWPLALCGVVKGGQAELYPNPVIDVKLSNEFNL